MFTVVLYTFALCLHYTQAEKHIGCRNPPVIERANFERRDSYTAGSVVEYDCDFGYIPSGYPRTAVCKYEDDEENSAKWIQPGFNCVPRSCGDPGFVNNARRSGSVFAFGSKVEYFCEDGYVLQGQFQRFCQASGAWTGQLPSCKKIQCDIPKDPENGRAVYDSLDYGMQVKYECSKGYLLQQENERFCSEVGQWSGSEPECVETFCEEPKPPLHGSMELVLGKTTIGSIVVYSCDEGYVLHGSKTSKCFSTAEWTSPTPRCSELCKVPEVENGIIGVYEKRYGIQRFKVLSSESAVEDGQELHLRCAKDYEPSGQRKAELKLSCSNGVWSDEPVCEPVPCRNNPPQVPNADLITADQKHGATLTYLCKSGFVKAKYGSMTCKFGIWIGELPICRDTQCYQADLRFQGLKRNAKEKYQSGNVLIPHCIEGYVLSSSSKSNITCNDGRWEVSSPPCTPAKCSGPPPSPPHGKILSFTGHHGSFATVSCDNEYHLVGDHSSPKCSFGKWETKENICQDTRCYWKDLQYNEGVDITDTSPTLHNRYGKIVCVEGYTTKSGFPLCLNGTWKYATSSSPCQPSSCAVNHVHNGYFQKSEKRYNWLGRESGTVYVKENIGVLYLHGSSLYVTCRSPHVFQGTTHSREAVTCSRGKWTPHPDCISRGQPMARVTTKKTVSSTKATTVLTSATSKAKLKPLQAEVTPAEAPSTISYHDYVNPTTQPPEDIYSEDMDNDVSLNSSLDNSGGNCSCLYNYSSPDVIAHSNMEQLHIGSRVKNGCSITFLCSIMGYHRLEGASEIHCENCSWSTMEFPTCEKPKQYDAVITIVSADSRQLTITPSGSVTALYGMPLNINCHIVGHDDWAVFINIPKFIEPKYTSVKMESSMYHLYTDLVIRSANSSYNGKYECRHGSFLGNPNHITLEVKDPVCPEIDSETLVITYSNHRKAHSRVLFQCLDSTLELRGSPELTCLESEVWSGDVPKCEYKKCPLLNVPDGMTLFYSNETRQNSQVLFKCKKPYAVDGSEVITCLANQQWSDAVPTCKLVTCSIQSLMEQLPENVVPFEEDVTADVVPYGQELKLTCVLPNLMLVGTRNITCSKSGTWVIEDVSCVRGCRRILPSEESKLMIEPKKESYRFGELVTFSCPSGFRLSSPVVQMVCLTDGWSENEKDIPTCLSI